MDFKERFTTSTFVRKLTIEGLRPLAGTSSRDATQLFIDTHLLTLASDANPNKVLRKRAQSLERILLFALKNKQEPIGPKELPSLRIAREEPTRLIIFVVSEHEYACYFPESEQSRLLTPSRKTL